MRGAQSLCVLYLGRFRQMSADVKHIFLKVGHGQPMLETQSATAIKGSGLAGDLSYGKKARQVLLIEYETLEEFSLSPGDVHENFTTVGIKLNDLPASAQLRIGQALLEVVGKCGPCSQLDDLRPGLQEEIRDRRGILASVLQGGVIEVGDQIAVESSVNHPEGTNPASGQH